MKQLNIYRLFNMATLALSAALAAGCGASAEKAEKTEANAAPVLETFAVKKEVLSSRLHIPGELISFQQVDLYARENSFVKKILVDVGSVVKEGQLLASLEAPELTSRQAGADSRQQSQEAIYKASKANYDRLLETSKTPGTISQNDLDQALAKMNSDYAQWQSALAAQREVGATRNYLEIRAPFSGVITARNVNPGAYVGPSGKGSDHAMFTLQEQQRLRLVVSVPEAYTSYLHANDTVNFTVRARNNELFTATVARRAGALDTRLRAERVEMDVANTDRKLLPGMVSDVQIPLDGESTFVVPKTAIINAAEGVFVIRVEKGTAHWVDIRMGRSEGGRTEIYGMLNEGDTLVLRANEEVRRGAAVKTR